MTYSSCPYIPKLARTLYCQHIFEIVLVCLEHLDNTGIMSLHSQATKNLILTPVHIWEHLIDNAIMPIHSQATQNSALTYEHFSPVTKLHGLIHQCNILGTPVFSFAHFAGLMLIGLFLGHSNTLCVYLQTPCVSQESHNANRQTLQCCCLLM